MNSPHPMKPAAKDTKTANKTVFTELGEDTNTAWFVCISALGSFMNMESLYLSRKSITIPFVHPKPS